MPSASKLHKYCGILQYLEHNDPDFWFAIKDVCVGRYFVPRGKFAGVTFLHPQDDKYKKRIIAAAASDKPEVAASMVRALILVNYYPTESSFGKSVENALRQSIDIKEVSSDGVVFANGLVAKKDPKFVQMDLDNRGRSNLAVYTLSGKGEVPTDGKPVVRAPRPGGPTSGVRNGPSLSTVVTGGAEAEVSLKDTLQRKVADMYKKKFDNNNIYVKKVTLHLSMMMDNGATKEGLRDWLGNDEISDSFLLDMYCANNCPGCFKLLLECLEEVTDDTLDPRVEKITRATYIETKKKLLGSEYHNKEVKRDVNLNEVYAAVEFRSILNTLYSGDENRMGKDMFIVFCNINKDMWTTEAFDKASIFEDFYINTTKIYTTFKEIVNHRFDLARDLTFFGYLLKTDVLLYTPQADFSSPDSVNLPIVDMIPSPVEKSQFSMCFYINKLSSAITGGGAISSNANDFLSKLSL